MTTANQITLGRIVLVVPIREPVVRPDRIADVCIVGDHRWVELGDAAERVVQSGIEERELFPGVVRHERVREREHPVRGPAVAHRCDVDIAV